MSRADIFNDIVEERRSVRIFDNEADWDEAAVERSLHRAILAPNSSNLQLWEFYRIKSEAQKAKAVPICLGQNAAKTAKELVVIAARKDKWKERRDFVFSEAKKGFDGSHPNSEKLTDQYYNKLIPIQYTNDFLGIFSTIKKIGVSLVGLSKPMARGVGGTDVRIVAHKSAALAAQTFMLSMKAEGYDSCPMEGFDEVRMKKLLNLPRGAEITMVIGVGKGSPKGIYGKRIRLSHKNVIFNI